MESELSGCSGMQSDADLSTVMPHNQNYDYKDMRNISVQTGEEFSPEFLRERVSRKMPFANDVNRTSTSKPAYDAIQSHHHVHTGSQGIRRSDSENSTEFSEFCPSKRRGFDSPSDSPHSNHSYSKASGNLDRTFSGKVKFLCSFGGRILPRPNDAKLRYVGGDTRIISITKDLTYNELVKKTTAICNYNHMIKYQLPGEDLDALISVSSDEDLQHMIDEYHDLERKSQRLRLFLVSYGDCEGPSSLESISRQKSDSHYQYVVAVNGISPRRSSSRESLESQWVINLDGSPTVQQKEPTNSFRRLENQVKDPKTLSVRDYENGTCPYGYRNNCPYVVDIPGYDNPGFIDSGPVIGGPNPISFIVQSHAPPKAGSHFRKPSNEFQSSLPYSPSCIDARRDSLNGDKLVPCQDTFSFCPVSDFDANSCKRVNELVSESQPATEERSSVLVHGAEKTFLPFAVEKLPKNAVASSSEGVVDQPFQEPSNLNKDCVEWGKGTMKWMNNQEISFDQDRKNYAINNAYSLKAEFLDHKQNLPQITCHPKSKLSVHVPGSHNAAKNIEVWKEPYRNDQISPKEPDFLIKSQKEGSNTTFLGCHGPLSVGSKENNNQSKIIAQIQLPEDESSLGIYPSRPNFLPETSTNDALGGGAYGGSVKNKNANTISHEDLDIKNGTFFKSGSSDISLGPHVPGKPVTDEHRDEAESLACASENDDKADDGDKDESISDAAIIEMEASIYDLQIIRNTDLEELQELGSGTFGTVYHGKWRGTDVAIKRIKKSCFTGGSSEQERLTKDFWREAKILSRLHHPNIVAFYGVVPDGPGGTLATVSEYMANGSLRHVLLRKDRALDRRKKVIIALDASFGMEYLHLKNIVHFDLKCDNLLVNLADSQRPVCKVTDFGLSRIKQNTLVSGGVRGTLPWMAPELLNGNSSRVSEKVDIFSFGVAMWEILTGEEPYIDMHCGAIIGGIVNNTLRPRIPERCDPEWRKLMEECWSYDPSARPSFTEITKRLQVMSTALQPKKFNRVKR
ncbi:hypothetical protein OROMI_026528 [Orobanche minor]